MANNEELSLKDRLAIAGISVERAYKDGHFVGVKLVKNGHYLKCGRLCCYDYGLSICGFFCV